MNTQHLDPFFAEEYDAQVAARAVAGAAMARLLIWQAEAPTLEDRGLRTTVALYCVRPDLIAAVTLAEIGEARLRSRPQCERFADPLCSHASMKPFVKPSLARSPRRPAPIFRGIRPRPSTGSLPYAAFIAYSSVPAARRALTHLSRLVRMRSDALTLQPMLWRCDQLEHPRWREMALRDATRAQVLVLALSGAAPLETAMETWLTQLASRMHGLELTAFAFTEDDEGWTISLQARTKRAPAPLAQMRPAPVLASAPSRALAVETQAARAA